MNRKKSYRILAVLLFFAFISLISRSIIYLVISSTVAFLIFILLSKDMQERRQSEGKRQPKEKEGKVVYTVSPARSTLLMPAIFTGAGGLMTAYGYTGLYEIDTVFVTLGWMVEPRAILIFFFIFGVFLALYGILNMLKIWLR